MENLLSEILQLKGMHRINATGISTIQYNMNYVEDE